MADLRYRDGSLRRTAKGLPDAPVHDYQLATTSVTGPTPSPHSPSTFRTTNLQIQPLLHPPATVPLPRSQSSPIARREIGGLFRTMLRRAVLELRRTLRS